MTVRFRPYGLRGTRRGGIGLDLEALSRNHWIRAATLAQAVLSQSLSDEHLDELRRPTPVSRIPGLRAA